MSRRAVVIDAAWLGAIAILSALPYVARLGFYSDDWSLLQGFAASGHGRFLDLVSGGFPGRPVQGLYLAALFEVFGFEPIGYHLVDTLVLAACAALFYLILVRLRFSRAMSFAAVVLFLMLPQLSTVRVWYSAFQIPLSMALMFASMHWQLSFSRTGRVGALAAAIVSAVLSVGAYEIFAPLIAGFAAWLVFMHWRRSERRDRRPIAWAVLLLVLMLIAFAYKLTVSGRAGAVGDPKRYLLGLHQLFRLDYDWRTDSGLNIVATPRTHFWAPVEGWWIGAEALVRGQVGVEVTAIAAAIGAIALWRLGSRREGTAALGWRSLLLLGIVAFLLGNATFLIVPAVAFTSTGMDNRVQVAAAIGVAMIFAALICLGAAALPLRLRQLGFAVVVAGLSVVGFARLSGIEAYWAEAPALQQRVLSAARSDLRNLPADSTVILDGVCPYDGPAVVLETSWDISGALRLALGRPVNGDAVSPRMSPTAAGLATSIYKTPSFYPYGPNLYVYNPVKHQLVRLANRAAATDYFDNRKPRPCPGYVARGVEV